MMDKELQKHHEHMFSVFCSDGWKELMEDLDGMIAARDRLDSVKTGDELQFAKGELSVMRWLRNLEPSHQATYEQLKEEAKNADL